MADRDGQFDPVRTLTDHAAYLNAISSPSSCPKVFYEIMSGAVVWSDEMTIKIPVELIWALRSIVAYRTSLMLNKPREELRSMWELGLSLFPEWVGFRPERRTATLELLNVYRRGAARLRKCLRDIKH